MHNLNPDIGLMKVVVRQFAARLENEAVYVKQWAAMSSYRGNPEVAEKLQAARDSLDASRVSLLAAADLLFEEQNTE